MYIKKEKGGEKMEIEWIERGITMAEPLSGCVLMFCNDLCSE
jgi:hypothetical protein